MSQNETKILPVLDMDTLQQKATEAAMKGAMTSIDEFYTGWSSPYRKQIDEHLKKTQINGSIDLPDIISLINEKLTKEIDLIANTAVSKSFIPLVQKFLTREDKEIKFSDILKKFIETHESKNVDYFEVSVKESKHGWLDVKISCEDKEYDLTLHADYHSKKEDVKKYQFLSLPRNTVSDLKQTMKLSLDGVTLEMPFTRDVLHDDFTSYIARLVIGNSLITMDCSDFDEDWFRSDEECHC